MTMFSSRRCGHAAERASTAHQHGSSSAGRLSEFMHNEPSPSGEATSASADSDRGHGVRWPVGVAHGREALEGQLGRVGGRLDPARVLAASSGWRPSDHRCRAGSVDVVCGRMRVARVSSRRPDRRAASALRTGTVSVKLASSSRDGEAPGRGSASLRDARSVAGVLRAFGGVARRGHGRAAVRWLERRRRQFFRAGSAWTAACASRWAAASASGWLWAPWRERPCNLAVFAEFCGGDIFFCVVSRGCWL
jgi:hypothetical protein